jgi:hypothetical protein
VETDHSQHGDRVGADTRYVEICWKCAEDWQAYIRKHPDEMPNRAFIVTALRPIGAKR